MSAGEVTLTAVHLEEDGHDGGHGEGEPGSEHNLVVLRKVAEGYDLVDRTKNIAPGETATLRLDLEPGEYELVCDVVDEVDDGFVSHAKEGMRTPFLVE